MVVTILENIEHFNEQIGDPRDLRNLFSGQARLLAERASRDLDIDERSVKHLLLVYLALRDSERAA